MNHHEKPLINQTLDKPLINQTLYEHLMNHHEKPRQKKKKQHVPSRPGLVVLIQGLVVLHDAASDVQQMFLAISKWETIQDGAPMIVQKKRSVA